MRRLFPTFAVAMILYLASYLAFRAQSVERWQRDGKEYVIVPLKVRWVYYAFRPIMYVDGAATGMRFHIGPHDTELGPTEHR